jgi:tetratricopeptide (TPR) repeat protein
MKYGRVKFLLIQFTAWMLVLTTVESAAQNAKISSDTNIPAGVDEKYGTGSNALLNIYQKWISPIRGSGKCPMHPSCSQYSKMVFASEPLPSALTRSLERLMRCGRDLQYYNKIKLGTAVRWHDPSSPMLLPEDLPSLDKTKSIHLSDRIILNTSNGTYQSQDTLDTGFADFLFKQGEYDRAITEYLRLQYLAKHPAKQAYLIKKIGQCYYNKKDYQQFKQFYQRNKERLEQYPLTHFQMNLLQGKTHYHLQEFQQAISSLFWNEKSSLDYPWDEMHVIMGLSYCQLDFWEEGKKHFLLVDERSSGGNIAAGAERILSRTESISTRSPLLAGSLSALIPGMGYLYTNHPGTALASFVLNGILIWATYDAIHSKNYGIASATGLFGIGWYIGNIKGSANAARRYNRRVREDLLNEILHNVSIDDPVHF